MTAAMEANAGIDLAKTKASIIAEFPDVFSKSVPPMSGEPFKIVLKSDVPAVNVGVPRHVSIALRDKYKMEIDKLLSEKIIAAQTKPTDWVSPVVLAPRKGSDRVRLCVDFRELNKAINREFYYSPPPQVSVCDLPKGKAVYFSKLDARLGYHQVALDAESQDLTTFITPFGRFKYLRAPFGLSNIGECFNRKMEEHLETYKFHESERRATDDNLLFDSTIEGHIQHVKQFLQRCREKRITIAPDKFEFCKTRINFAGYDVTKDGYTPAVDLVGALTNFPTPKNLTDLKSFLGVVGQFAEAAPELAKKAEPLRGLLKKGNEFLWQDSHEAAMADIKRYCVSLPSLTFFDYKRETRLIVDASRKGIGFCLQQKHEPHWRFVSCGSRFLTPAERNYSMIELEALAIVWAVLRSKMFLQGMRHFSIVSDHRPLLPIFNRMRLDEIGNPRLRRLKHKVVSFNYDLIWIAGKMNLIADAFSRAPVETLRTEKDVLQQSHGETEVDGNVVSKVASCIVGTDMYAVGTPKLEMIDQYKLPLFIKLLKAKVKIIPDKLEASVLKMGGNLPFDVALQELKLPKRLQNFLVAAEKQGDYSELKTLIEWGFPATRKELPEHLRQYWKYRANLSVIHGLIVFNLNRFFVPEVLRQQILTKCHLAHQGQKRFVLYMKNFYFWPRLATDAVNFVKNYSFCQDVQKSNPKEGNKSLPPVTFPMEEVHSDVAKSHGTNVWVGLDRFSGWIKAYQLSSLHCKETKNKFLDWSRSWGCPVRIITDNATNYTGHEMQEWVKEWEIVHSTSTPYSPRSNGWAENAVQSAKKLIAGMVDAKGRLDWDAVEEALLQRNNTPNPYTDNLAPSQILFGRLLPDKASLQWGRPQFDQDADFMKYWQKRHYELRGKYVPVSMEMDRRRPILRVGDFVAIKSTDPNCKTYRWKDYGKITAYSTYKNRYAVLRSDRVPVWKTREQLRPRQARSIKLPCVDASGRLKSPERPPKEPPVTRSKTTGSPGRKAHRQTAKVKNVSADQKPHTSGYVPIRFREPTKVTLPHPDDDAFNMAGGISHANLQTGHVEYSTREPLPRDHRGRAVFQRRGEVDEVPELPKDEAELSSSDEEATEDQKYIEATAYWYAKWSTKRLWREQLALNQALVIRNLRKRRAAKRKGKSAKRARRDENLSEVSSESNSELEEEERLTEESEMDNE